MKRYAALRNARESAIKSALSRSARCPVRKRLNDCNARAGGRPVSVPGEVSLSALKQICSAAKSPHRLAALLTAVGGCKPRTAKYKKRMSYRNSNISLATTNMRAARYFYMIKTRQKSERINQGAYGEQKSENAESRNRLMNTCIGT